MRPSAAPIVLDRAALSQLDASHADLAVEPATHQAVARPAASGAASLSRPLVLLALADDPAASALHAALLDHSPPLRVKSCPTAEALLDAAATESAALILISHRLDDTAGARVLRELSAFGASAQAIVLFDDAADPRRAQASQAGAYDYIVSPAQGHATLLALVDRIILRDALEARLDATNRQFRVLIENSNDGIYILIRGQRFVYTNRRFQELVGFSSDELGSDDFDIDARIVAPESRHILESRVSRLAAGLPVEPRYEFVAQRKNGTAFDAQVSLSYIEFEGEAASLGIMQDITERKQFEQQLLRKNRELALLNELAASINQAVALDETLLVGCRRTSSLLGAEATGIALLASDRRSLELRASEGLDEPLMRALASMPLDTDSMLAHTVRTGEVSLIEDVHADVRVAIGALRNSRFRGCLLVPLKARDHIVGAAFVLTSEGRVPTSADRDLMVAIGTLLGNAVEKASLLAIERANVRRLKALDEIAVALASTLDVDEVALVVARSVHRLFGAVRVMIAKLDDSGRFFLPVHVLDGGEPVQATVPIPVADTIMGLCLVERSPVQRIRPGAEAGARSIDPGTSQPVDLLPYEQELFRQGVGAGVAVPVLNDGAPVGALWLGYAQASPLSEQDLAVLSSLGNHVAISIRNSALFAARNLALEELKAAQQKLVESEKINAIGMIAAGVAHDFNNVLSAILGRAQLMRSQLRDPAMQKHADIIEKAAIDGAETVRRVQQIGRQEHTDDFVPVELAEILNDVVDLTLPRWRDLPAREGRPIDLHIDVPHDDALFVSGSPHELREVLINLVHNAVDAMPDGGRIALAARVQGDACQVLVHDTGVGITEEVRARIFDPFFTTKGEKGTGLGLSVSQSIIRRHGGDIDVQSRMQGPERGTTFLISLPRIPRPTAGAATSSADAGPDPGHARVLVIDDEENIRDILTDMLSSGDHEVVTAADGPEGLDKLEQGRFDLVFTDLGLPGMNGYDVAAAIKRKHPTLPVSLVTGWGATLDPEKARAHGVDLVISKPFRYEQVLKLVDDALLSRNR
jgi:PAS domain S-box-containing protein